MYNCMITIVRARLYGFILMMERYSGPESQTLKNEEGDDPEGREKHPVFCYLVHEVILR